MKRFYGLPEIKSKSENPKERKKSKPAKLTLTDDERCTASAMSVRVQ